MDSDDAVVAGSCFGISVIGFLRYITEPRMRKKNADAKLYEAQIQNKIDNIRLENSLSILEKTKERLDENSKIADPDGGWFLRFLRASEDITDEEIQTWFAAILAGELESNGSYATRTLDVLKNLSKDEANLFKRLSKYAVWAGKRVFIANVNPETTSNAIYDDQLTLDDFELITINSRGYTIQYTDQATILYGDRVAVFQVEKTEEMKNLQIDSIGCLTKAGTDLFNLMKNNDWIEYDYDFFELYIKELSKRNNLHASIHKITEQDGTSISYITEPICEF